MKWESDDHFSGRCSMCGQKCHWCGEPIDKVTVVSLPWREDDLYAESVDPPKEPK